MSAINRSLRSSLKSAVAGAVSATFSVGLAATAAAQVALPQAVEQTSLAQDAFATGTLEPRDGALPRDLWRGADPRTLMYLLDAAPTRPATPSLGAVMKRTLLSPGEGPSGATPSLGGKKLLALARAGFVSEARTVASISNAPRNDPWVGQALAVADLLEGKRDDACQRNASLTEGRDATFWVKLRVLCYAAAGELDAADLTLGLLRENGALSETDDALLTPLTAGVAPKTLYAPETALHLAILRQSEIELTPGLLGAADAGVLKAVALDVNSASDLRIVAAQRAAAMGVLNERELAALFQGFEIDVAALGAATDRAAVRPGDPMTDAALYQSIQQMKAPEFLRDKAQRISLALSVADTFERAYAAALLYAADIRALEGALVAADQAGRFALARMAVGDADRAARWLTSMAGAGGVSAMDESDAMDFIELVNLLNVLDPSAAAPVARRAGVAIEPPRSAVLTSSAASTDTLAPVVEAAFDAALDEIPGQAGLAALAASRAVDDRLARIVVNQSLRAAGLSDMRRRLDFEAAWRAQFPGGNSAIDGGDNAAATEGEGDIDYKDDGLLPRLKPPVSD